MRRLQPWLGAGGSCWLGTDAHQTQPELPEFPLEGLGVLSLQQWGREGVLVVLSFFHCPLKLDEPQKYQDFSIWLFFLRFFIFPA